jgi:hypothetical protein
MIDGFLACLTWYFQVAAWRCSCMDVSGISILTAKRQPDRNPAQITGTGSWMGTLRAMLVTWSIWPQSDGRQW